MDTLDPTSAYASDVAHGIHGNVDWDLYYWAPIPSRYILFPLPRRLSERVSLDVLYNIVDNLDSEVDRSSVALVCRDWYEHFGYIRYPDLCIRSRRGLNLLLDTSLASGRMKRRLDNTTTLRIHQDDGDSKASYYDAVPLTLATRMPAVRSLVFHGCIRPHMHSSFARNLHLFRHILSLELSSFALESFGELRRIIVACPRLHTLILRDGKCVASRPPSPTTLAQSMQRQKCTLQLRRLELRRLDFILSAALVAWLVMAGPVCCEGITDLAVTEVTGPVSQMWIQLLQAIGPSLETLQLVCARGRGCTTVDELALSLASNPNLRRLEILIEPDYNDFTDMLSPEELDDGFPRTSGWWPIFKTVPRVAQADIEVKFTRTVWDAFARSYSRPVSKIIHSRSHSPLEEFVRVGRARTSGE
ncbi:uncharacterized protein B0H18DRAFT_1124873 [Fomitopsis serialis]|uniref:uncharacterized protein n=1 Tax=Fomitopsis serialis TaxID=139415 RepID=UPI002007F988|nr:uncharacterized protein B0H18DRAFT_1124873 [Neoantrodia serialis]KAH9915482.1 hypothetical protein B0H18DRAFT_1124873 [Neoantrodia serialis]